MRIISLINDKDVIEDILRHCGMRENPALESGPDPPDTCCREKPPLVYEPVYDDFQNMPDEYPRNKIVH